MIAVYLTLGLLFLFTDIAIDTFPVYRKPVGIIMIVYGVLRTFLTIRKIKNQHEQEN